jgi:predicted Holliday junction resolvase-like endonuclease
METAVIILIIIVLVFACLVVAHVLIVRDLKRKHQLRIQTNEETIQRLQKWRTFYEDNRVNFVEIISELKAIRSRTLENNTILSESNIQLRKQNDTLTSYVSILKSDVERTVEFLKKFNLLSHPKL